MKFKELLRLVWLNLFQNKFKVILTSIGIIVGAATIVMVIAIGKGGQMEVAEQFKNINAGAVDISYEVEEEASSATNFFSSMKQMFGGLRGQAQNSGNSTSGNASGSTNSMPQPPDNSTSGGTASGESSQTKTPPSGNDSSTHTWGGKGNFPGSDFITGNSSSADDRVNQEQIYLSEDDLEDLQVFLPGISNSTISYTTKNTVDGGELEAADTYTIAGVKSNYAELSNLKMQAGQFVTDSNDNNSEKICILGASVAKEIFGSVEEAYDSTLYIDDRAYIVNGIIEAMGTVSSGISPDDTIFIPYATGVKYITGKNVSSTITVIAEDVSDIETVVANAQTVLAETYPNAEFSITDAGTKMEAASKSNNTLTMLLIVMAIIVFIVGGIGIMNVLFVSVKERTNEIGILKALGCKRKDILVEFLLEASFISVIGGILGVVVSFGVAPIIEQLGTRVELSAIGAVLAIVFAVLTGTLFGFYPAYKASKLVPIEALNEE